MKNVLSNFSVKFEIGNALILQKMWNYKYVYTYILLIKMNIKIILKQLCE